MKRSNLVLAAASLVLAAVSVAATKPMRTLTQAYIQLTSGGAPAGCQATLTACIKGADLLCTATENRPSTIVYSTRKNLNTCDQQFIKQAD